MREISTSDLLFITGGSAADAATIGGALGGAAGVSYGMGIGASGSAVVGLAGIGAAAGAGLAVAGAAGWSAGQWLIQSSRSSVTSFPTHQGLITVAEATD